MVMTHSGIAKSKKDNPVVMKETNLNRKFMSKDQVLEENKKLAEKKRRMAEAEAKIDDDLDLTEEPETIDEPEKEEASFIPKQPEEQSDGERIAELTALKGQQKGPGSKAKKERIQSEINSLSAV